MKRAKRLTQTTSVLALALCVACTPTASAERGVLNADGLFKVKGADLSAAHITVVPQGAPAFSVQVNSANFLLELPLNDMYLVHFERSGCPTKQVYFDTRVPVEYHADQFTFRFKVTLERMALEHMFEYEGPVGFVRYIHRLHDFGYETQYVVKVDDELRERSAQMLRIGIDPKTFLTPTAKFATVRRSTSDRHTSRPEHGQGEVAPIVRELPRMVHVVEHPTTDATAAREAIPELRPRSVSVERPPAEPKVRSVNDIALSHPYRTPFAEDEGPAQPSAEGSLPLAKDLPPLMTIPTHGATNERRREVEFFQEERCVIYVVRFIAPNGAVDELRKVVHAYGAVFYFDNSRSITERDFAQLSATP